MKTMEALDNPSYFTVPGATQPQSKFSMLTRRGMGVASSSTSLLSQTPATHVVTNGSGNRRSFRSILRSMSNDNDSTHLFVMGNPRPSDLAPGHRPRRRASSSASELLINESSAAGNDEDGEVFVAAGGNPRYYNLTTPRSSAGKRRHSIGTFLRSGPGQLEHSYSLKRRCENCIDKGNIKNEDMLDIMILSHGRSETPSHWVSYLSSCYQKISKEQNRPPFKLVCVQLEDIIMGIAGVAQQERYSKARLQIVILCPSFLSHINDNPGPASVLTNLIQPGRAIVMLLGITEESVTVHHRAALLGFDEWRKVVVKDQDQSFVTDFLGMSMDILSRSWQIQEAINQIRNDENRAHFSILPKKVKVGQNKLIILLNEPVDINDKILITIDKNGQRLEAVSVKRRNPYTIQFTMPATCLQVSMLASIFVEKNGKDLGHRLVKCESQLRELDQLLRCSNNPLQFMCQSLGLNYGDKDQLDLFLVSALQRNLPPHFNLLSPPSGHRFYNCNEEYPTLLHFSAHFGLEKLSWQLLECPGGEQACQLRNSCQLTPADMAERTGHVRLANTLKGFLQMTELSSMYSYLKGMSCNNSPGFSEANYLLPRPLNDTYLVPPAARPVTTLISTSTVNMTSIFTASSPTTSVSQPSTPFYSNLEYKVPPSPVLFSGVSSEYDVPPSPLQLPLDSIFVNEHLILNQSTLSPPTSVPTTPISPKDNFPPGVYLEMHSSDVSASSSKLAESKKKSFQSVDDDRNKIVKTPSSENDYTNSDIKQIENCRKGSTSSNNSAKHSQHSIEDELIEIINDFKNNVFTISEVEKLVANWQNRHDVQQSFKEKQEQLNAMREEYERIQLKMKLEMKRATPFERIRKFFSRSKSKHGTCSGECKKRKTDLTTEGIIQTGNVCHRPASSLSLGSSCSSGSSGRMSTGSGTSVGDSGTHSDHEEKKTTTCDVTSVIDPSSKDTASEQGLARPPTTNNLTEYVDPDNNQCLSKLDICTSLKEGYPVIKTQQVSDQIKEDTPESTRLVENLSESNISETTCETNRELAVVEVHPPPMKEVSLTSDQIQAEYSQNNFNQPSCSHFDKKHDIEEDTPVKNNESNDQSSIDINNLSATFKKCCNTKSISENRTNGNLSNDYMNDCDDDDRSNCNYKARSHITKNQNRLLMNLCHNSVTNHEYMSIPEQYEEDNSDEESAKETDNLLENLQVHEYMNITSHSPPPVPPRYKCSNVS